MNCKDICRKTKSDCVSKECKHWINFSKDNNCSLISIDKNGSMKLKEIAERMGVTIATVIEIEKKAKSKYLKILSSN